MRIGLLGLVMLLEVIGFVASYNQLFRHAPLADRVLLGSNFLAVIVLALVVLYDERYFARNPDVFRGPRGATGPRGAIGPKGDTGQDGLP